MWPSSRSGETRNSNTHVGDHTSEPQAAEAPPRPPQAAPHFVRLTARCGRLLGVSRARSAVYTGRTHSHPQDRRSEAGRLTPEEARADPICFRRRRGDREAAVGLVTGLSHERDAVVEHPLSGCFEFVDTEDQAHLTGKVVADGVTLNLAVGLDEEKSGSRSGGTTTHRFGRKRRDS